MEQEKEAVYLINDNKYLHLRENGAGVGFATYKRMNGELLESGQVSEMNLPPDGRNALPAARNWYMFVLSDEPCKAIQRESVQILESIPNTGIDRRRIWKPETFQPDVRLINSHYDDIYRIPDGGVIQIDFSDGSSFTARVKRLDDYHFDLGGLGDVYHICQFAEIMERNGASAYPEIQTQDDQGAWMVELWFFLHDRRTIIYFIIITMQFRPYYYHSNQMPTNSILILRPASAAPNHLHPGEKELYQNSRSLHPDWADGSAAFSSPRTAGAPTSASYPDTYNSRK